jgi:peptidyl-prolyl cis-trans isomerase B (cyclophilin B)
MKHLLFACVMSLALGLTAARAQETNKAAAKKEEPKTATTNEVAVMKTSLGEMVIEFWPDVAPNTVDNFKTLAGKGFYDGTCFHRIIKGFMIQGGDPLTKDPSKEAMWGTGDPGYKIKAEFNNLKTRSHQKGVLSMARSRDPNSAGSQFFICHGDASRLDGQYTTFGTVIKGEDVLDKIASVPCVVGSEASPSKPTQRVDILSVKIVDRATIK